MTRHRRIEITAFRHRIVLGSSEPLETTGVTIQGDELDESVELASSDEQQILLEAIRILTEKIGTEIREVAQ